MVGLVLTGEKWDPEGIISLNTYEARSEHKVNFWASKKQQNCMYWGKKSIKGTLIHNIFILKKYLEKNGKNDNLQNIFFCQKTISRSTLLFLCAEQSIKALSRKIQIFKKYHCLISNE